MPISPGNTYIVFRWSGVDYELPYANITSYDCRPIYAADGYTLDRYETTLSGSCIVSDGTATFVDFATKLQMGTGQLDRVRVRVTASGGTEDLLDVSYPDTMNGPLLHLQATEINGRQACLITFTVTAATAYPTSSSAPLPDYPVISHRWTQRFALDAAGLITRTVAGVLTVNLAAQGAIASPAPSGSFADVDGRLPYADLFRKAIAPADTLSAAIKWRRESQTFAYNEAGNQLIYEITDVQARTNLPDAAFAGNCEFTYERNRSNLAWGIFRFSCDLEGPADGDTRELINAAVLLSQSRMNFSRFRIQRMVITEQTMLTKAKIRFEVDADSPAVGTVAPVTTVASVPVAEIVGRNFTVSRSCDWRPDSYGNAGGVYGSPHWLGNLQQAKPESSAATVAVAEMVAVLTASCPATVPTISFVGSDDSFAVATAAIQAGPFQPAIAKFSSDAVVKAVEKVSTVTNVEQDTKMHRLQTMYTQGADFVFQLGKAAVDIIETVTVRSVNEAPARIYRPMPAGFMLVHDSWRVNHGEIGPDGNRTFTGIYTRISRAYDGGGSTSNGYATSGSVRRWWPTQQTVVAPLTPGYDATVQVSGSSVIDVVSSNTQTYNVGTAPSYL
jgi:hypothetical protein